MRKQTRRKKWYAAEGMDTLRLAAEGAAVTEERVLNQMRDRERLAMDRIRRGEGDGLALAEIESMCRISLVMAERGIGPEVLVSAKLLEIELRNAKKILVERGRFVLTGPGLRAMQDVQEYHDLQRQSIPRSVYEDCILKVVQRERSKAYA